MHGIEFWQNFPILTFRCAAKRNQKFLILKKTQKSREEILQNKFLSSLKTIQLWRERNKINQSKDEDREEEEIMCLYKFAK